MTLKALTRAGLAVAVSAGAFSLLTSANAAGSTPAPESATTANPAPTAAERASAGIGNAVDQAVGSDKPITKAELTHAISLAKIDNPALALSTAQIKNRAGQAVGTVSSVDVTPEGKAKAIHADVGGFLGMGTHVVALDADKLVYLKSRNLLVTRLSKKQIEALVAEAPANG
jgi:hypothetical protein